MEHPDLLLEVAQFQHQNQLREVDTWRLARIARQERARYGGHLLHRLVSAARLLFILALLTLLCSTFPVAQAAPGDGDTTFAGFGNRGVITETVIRETSGMTLQPDGKVLVAYQSTGTASEILRYKPNGQWDSTFGNNGLVVIPKPPLLYFFVRDITLQADGQIVAAGFSRSAGTGSSSDNFMVVRLTSTGALDTSFGDHGFVLTDFDQQADYGDKVLIQPDGKIIVAGFSRIGDGFGYTIARYNANGSLDDNRDGDGGFGGNGKVTIGFPGNHRGLDIALQSDGKLVLVGDSLVGGDFDFALARLNPDGTPDNSFNGNGKLTDGFGGHDRATAVAIQPDGKIIVAGNSNNPDASLVARYLSNGKRDKSGFGSNGQYNFSSDTRIHDLALQSDGKIMAIGARGDNWVFYRLNPAGGPDESLNNGGSVVIDLGGSDIGTDIALQPDGRILAAGVGGGILNLARLWPDGTFDMGGQQTHSLTFAPAYRSGYRETVYGLAAQPDGSFLVAGQVINPAVTRGDAFVTRFQANGLPDLGFGTNGNAFIFGPGLFGAATAVAVQPDGKIVIAGYTAYNPERTAMDFMVARFLPTGAIDFNFGTGGVTLVDFVGGADSATALALAPDGKIVVAAPIQGSRYVWGVARLTESGQLDPSFNQDGWTYVGFNGDNGVNAALVQPDGKIILGGYFNGDFALQRLLGTGQPDPSFGSNGGYVLTNLGGTEYLNALALAPNGWIYAAGTRTTKTGNTYNTDMALAQYTPAGILASCADIANCHNWPSGTFFFNQASNDSAYALDLRADNQLIAAGCINDHFAAVQVRTDGEPTPLPFHTDFVGQSDCARAVKFSGQNKILLAGYQNPSPFIGGDGNIALARFETTVNTPGPNPTPAPNPTPNPTLSPVYLPIIIR